MRDEDFEMIPTPGHTPASQADAQRRIDRILRRLRG
jgi:hypothetical protein